MITRKEKRYITLMGDDIEKSRLSATFNSNEATASLAALAPSALMSETPAEMLSSMLDVSFDNAKDYLVLRYFVEKYIMNMFDNAENLLISDEKLKDLCIDKFPSDQDVFNSLKKHRLAIDETKEYYAWLLSFSVLVSLLSIPALTSMDPERQKGAIESLSGDAAHFTRLINGLMRFQKLSSGEWAIVKKPDGQEYVNKEYKIPGLSGPNTADGLSMDHDPTGPA